MSKALSEYSVVFLGDMLPPSKIILLKRSAEKKFAPGMYTGIGGHREESDITIYETMKRELEEETGITGIELTEFARLIVYGGGDRMLCYAFGVYDPNLLLPGCSEGTLEWVEIDHLLEKDIIPTTIAVVKEWKNRDFAIGRPFTLYQIQGNEGADPVVRPESAPLKEGLYEA